MSGQADDVEVLERAAEWLRDRQRVALATVIRTWGSSPRPPGSLLAMNGTGRFVGSVSGGCVEEVLVKRFCNGELAGQARTAIVALAHDPRQDDLGLSAALETQAFYIGALGSRRSAQARRARLQSLGFSVQQLDRVHGPAGIPIGSKRPAEIAVSILAEITATRNGIAAKARRADEA